MKEQDYTSFSDEILKDKLRKADLISKVVAIAMVILLLGTILLVIKGEKLGGYAGFVAVLTPFAVIYGQRAKAIRAELSKRNNS